MEKHKLIIIGAGPSGLTAAIYASRANLEPLVVEGDVPGGQLTWTTTVENFPGFPDGVDGPELMINMRKQATNFGARVISGSVTSVDFSKKPFTVFVENKEHQADCVIVASGASSRKLGIELEDKYLAKGLHTCATCDGAFYKGKIVAIVGGGDAAMEEAVFLTKFASKVYVIHRKDTLNASVTMQEKAKNNPKIEFIWNSEVSGLIGDEFLTGVKLNNLKTKEVSSLDLNGLFLAIGHVPNTKPFEGQLELDAKGFIKVSDLTKSSVEGVFVSGDVWDHRYRQAITASGFGCMAALDAEKYLSH